MSTKKTRKSDPKFLRAYDRGILRSSFVSLFWAVITERRKKGTYTLVQLAKQLGANKAEVSRWFKGEPNWTLGTIANIANALDVDLRVQAIDRSSGQVFTPAGAQASTMTSVTERMTSARAHTELEKVRITRVPEGAEGVVVQAAA
jgi:transcriptional regulator with XRE-family HTH domain